MGAVVGRFVGRELQRAQFDQVLAAALQGRGTCLAIAGEAGIGKTRLCEAFADAAVARGVGGAWAACWESLEPGFSPWTQLLIQLDGRPLHLGSVTTVDRAVARAELFADVVARLREACAQKPRLLVVDDLHWADEPTAVLTTHVLPALRGMPVVLVVAFRVEELAAHPVADLAERLRRVARTLVLPGLSVEETRALVASATGNPIGADAAARLHEATGGNPLFAGELAAMLSAGHAGDIMPWLGDLPLPDSVRDVLAARVRALSTGCQRVLELVAVLGEAASPAMVAEVLGEDTDTVLRAVDEAVRAKVLAPAGSKPSFAHPLLAAALVDGLSLPARVRLHERAGGVLLDHRERGEPVQPIMIAHHLLEAAVGGSAQAAVGWAARAADEAMASTAYETAAALRSRMLQVLDLDPSAGDRAEVLLGLGDAQAAAGRTADAEDAYRDAIDLARRDRRADVLARAVLGMTGGGGFEVPVGQAEHHDLLYEARAALGGNDPGLDCLLAARLSVSLTFAAPVARRNELAQQALTGARELSDPRVLAVALAAVCDTIAGPDGVEERLAATAEILQIAAHMGDLALELLGRRVRVVALLERGHVDEVDAEIDRYAAVTGRLGHAAYSWYVPLWRGMRALMRGQLAAYRGHHARLVELAEQSGSFNARMLLFAQESMAALQHGEDAREPLARMWDLVGGEDGILPDPQMHISAALIAAAAGDHRQAGALLDQWGEGMRSAEPDSEWLPMMVQAADTLAGLGEDRGGLAEWLHDTLGRYAHLYAVEGIGAYVNGSVARAVGLMAALLGRIDQAHNRVEAAARAEDAIGATALSERTRSQAARVLDRLTAQRGAHAGAGSAARPASGVFRMQGDHWLLDYAGHTMHVRDSKGMRDLAVLLARPGRGVAALDLATSAGDVRRRAPEAGAQPPGDLGEVLDARARAAYRQRVEAIEAELNDADRHGDTERSARLIAERDALLAELAAAYGLGGRPRRAGDPAERARTAVTARVRDAIRRIADVHPALGAHLRHAVRTGAVCCYDPETPTRWRI